MNRPLNEDLARTAARNEVYLTGRLAAVVDERELPSGSVLVTWRVVVDRIPAPERIEGVRTPTVDTLDCVARKPAVQRSARTWSAGDVIAVDGTLHRRFWRGPSGAPTSRYEVEVSKARRVGKGPVPAGARKPS